MNTALNPPNCPILLRVQKQVEFQLESAYLGFLVFVVFIDRPSTFHMLAQNVSTLSQHPKSGLKFIKQ